MNRTKLAAAAAAIAMALGAGTVAPAAAVDNIKIFGEQERLNGPNGFPYIGYTVYKLGPSKDPVPHRGQLFAAKLAIDTFGTGTAPMIERFGARTEKGYFYPLISGPSNTGMLYFDVTGPVPNSVVWNDGTRDILAWVPGELPIEGFWEAPPPPEPLGVPEDAVGMPGAMPAESNANIVDTPSDYAPAPFSLDEAIVAEPGFDAGGGGRR
ncbi:MAG: DUF1942 domain-containing protein [Mycobacterium sp.]|nr:DUF1942 domain-containing protein [Mycobacterium sp.]